MVEYLHFVMFWNMYANIENDQIELVGGRLQ